MKRNIILAFIFALLAAMLLTTSCTCYVDGETLRGCGYECANTCDGYDCALCADLFCPGYDIYRDYTSEHSYVAVKGVDYDSITLTAPDASNVQDLRLSIENLKFHEDSPWKLYAEIYLVQDGAVVGEYTINLTLDESLTTMDIFIIYNKFFNPNGGEVKFVFDSFALTRKGR